MSLLTDRHRHPRLKQCDYILKARLDPAVDQFQIIGFFTSQSDAEYLMDMYVEKHRLKPGSDIYIMTVKTANTTIAPFSGLLCTPPSPSIPASSESTHQQLPNGFGLPRAMALPTQDRRWRESLPDRDGMINGPCAWSHYHPEQHA